jgi:hypothetical protein
VPLISEDLTEGKRITAQIGHFLSAKIAGLFDWLANYEGKMPVEECLPGRCIQLKWFQLQGRKYIPDQYPEWNSAYAQQAYLRKY